MEDGFFLITGTSRGIGEALALEVLRRGNTVLGVSRKRSEQLKSPQYHHLALDLAETSRIGQILDRVHEIAENRNFDLVCLVSNASAIEPLKPIEDCPAVQIESHVRVGLIAPMILTSLFIREFSGARIRKKVAFLSSGLGVTPFPGLSIYCASKAALNMFARCVGLEQKDGQHGFEVICIGPGMVDTPMQEVARSKIRDEFPGADFFQQAFREGRLQKSGDVAAKIYAILRNQYEQGRLVMVGEV